MPEWLTRMRVRHNSMLINKKEKITHRCVTSDVVPGQERSTLSALRRMDNGSSKCVYKNC